MKTEAIIIAWLFRFLPAGAIGGMLGRAVTEARNESGTIAA